MIQDRQQFDAILDAALEKVKDFGKRQPHFPVWAGLQRHLERMKEVTSFNRYPRDKDKDTCLPGTIAMPELEPATDIEIYTLCQELHALQYYFQIRMKPPSLWSRFWRKK
jgi:hypothetical protein